MSKVFLKQYDTRTAIQAKLTKPNGKPVNLTNAEVYFIMGASRITVNRQANIIDPENGMVSFSFLREETEKTGIMRAEFKVFYPDGSEETFPNSGYLLVVIERSLSSLTTTPTPPIETKPPENIVNLIAKNISQTSLTLSWGASPSSGTLIYEVYRDGALVGQTANTEFNINNLAPSTEYSFMIKTKNLTTNKVSSGISITVTTIPDENGEVEKVIYNGGLFTSTSFNKTISGGSFK